MKKRLQKAWASLRALPLVALTVVLMVVACGVGLGILVLRRAQDRALSALDHVFAFVACKATAAADRAPPDVGEQCRQQVCELQREWSRARRTIVEIGA